MSKKENPKVLSQRLELRKAFNDFLKFLKRTEMKKEKETPAKPDEDKLKKSIAAKEKIIKGNKPVKK